MPVVVPPPVPRSAAAPPITLPLDAALLGGDEPGQDVSAPLTAAPPPPSPDLLVPPPVELPAPPAREPTTPRRILSRTAPPLVEPRPGPASERKPDGSAVEAEPARPAPSLAVPSERKSVDPGVLSDMARQLQAALSRSSSAVTPPPPVPSPAVPEGVDPLAAAMASAPLDPASPPVSPPVVPQEAPPPPAPVPPKPVLPPAMPKAAPVPPPPSSAPPEAKSAGNPFSVEEIEAEFARLLGRPLDKRS